MNDINYETNIKACVFELIVYKTYNYAYLETILDLLKTCICVLL